MAPTEAWSQQVAGRWTALAEELRRRLGPGTGLDAVERTILERRLGADLGPAVVHRSSLAGSLARGLGASALSADSHVLGDTAQLDATTTAGAALLAHELTHVVRGSRTRSHQVVQRALAGPVEADAEEVVAQRVEAETAAALQHAAGVTPPSAAASPDLDDLTDRVYRRILEVVIVEHERAVGAG